MLPLGGVLEKLVCKLIPDAKQPEKAKELAERRHAFLESFLREWEAEQGREKR